MKYQKFDCEQYLLDEYKKDGKEPVYYPWIDGTSLLVPSAYNGDMETFEEDLFAHPDKQKKYDRYNAAHPDNPMEIPEPIKYQDFYILPKLSYVQKGLSDKEIIRKTLREVRRRYRSTIKQTARTAREYPQQDFRVTLTGEYKEKIKALHHRHQLKKLGRGVGEMFKFTAKQTAEILTGAAGALPAVTYYLLDKKVHFAENKAKNFINKKALPYIRRGALKALIPLSIFTAIRVTPVIKQNKQEKIERQEILAREQAEKEAFFAKYDTRSEVFYQNYKQAKTLESEFLCLLSCYEDYHEKAYKCQAGEWTIGYGSRRLADGRKVTKGMTITQTEATQAVARHMEKYVYPQFRHITRKLTSEQLLAVSMFIYNTDESAFQKSKVCSAVNANESDEKVCEAFSYYRSVNGKRSYGLINRRGFEGRVWTCGDISSVLILSPNVAGSKHIKYFEYPNARSRDPIENDDGTFRVRKIKDVSKDMERYKVSSINKSLLGNIPEECRNELIKKYGITEQNGTLICLNNNANVNKQGKTISWEQAQVLAQAQTQTK